MLTAPNPAETHVGLRLSLSANAQVTVEVIDALQRLVMLPIANQEYLRGDHEIIIPVGSLPSGAYSVRVTEEMKIR